MSMIRPNNLVGSSIDSTANMVKILAKQKNGINLCHINAQSLNNKIDEFRLVFENSNVDVVCVSETWFTDSTPDSLIGLSGYTVFRSDRVRHAGGVAIYVKKNLKCKLSCKSARDEKIEYIFIEISSSMNKMLVGCVYRKNRYINLSDFFSKLETITVTYSDVAVLGDFNSNIMSESILTDEMLSLGLTPTNVTNPTHFSPTVNTLLDIIFVSNVSNVLLYDQISASCFSKHDLIFASYNFLVQTENESFSYRDFKNLNYNLLYEKYAEIEWDSMYYMPSVDEKLSFLENNILNLYNETVLLRTKPIKQNNNPWFTSDLELSIQRRDLAYSRWKRYKTPELDMERRAARREVKSKIKTAKVNYYGHRFGNALDSRSTWKTIRQIGIGRDINHISNDVDGDDLNQIFTNPENVPIDSSFYSFNSAINSTSTSNYCAQSEVIVDSEDGTFEFACVNEMDVFLSASTIKSNAVGHDDMHPKFIKILLPALIPHLTHLYNSIIMSSSFPLSWKHAKIIPISKSNGEYRPIAILSFLSKIFEKLLFTQINKYLVDKNLLTAKQSGFRSKHSCVTALIDVSENIRCELDNNYVNLLVLLDHSKAFDTVNHLLLCKKLKHLFNFSSTAIQMIASYLMGRTQSVYVNNKTSSPLPLTRGVPQGSILGPLLFSIYANDLPDQLSHCKLHMYADDVQLYLSSPVLAINECVAKINSDLDNVHRWAVGNGLCLNPNKSKCLVIRKRTSGFINHSDIMINNQKIEVVNAAKNLGVFFNSNLSWSNHINSMVGQQYIKLRTLWPLQYFTPFNVRVLLAKTYLVPGLIYGCELFANSDSESKRKLNVLFNNIIRYVYGLRKHDHISSYAKSLFGVTFENLLKIRVLILLHKIIFTRTPSYLYNNLRFARSNRGQKLIIPRHRTLISEWQFFVYAVRLWNTLPHTQQTNSNALLFKNFLFEFFA